VADYECTGTTRSSINQERRIGPLLARPSSNSFLAAPRHQTANTLYAKAFQSTRLINAHSSAAPPPQSGFVQPISSRDPPEHFRSRPSSLLRDRAKKSLHNALTYNSSRMLPPPQQLPSSPSQLDAESAVSAIGLITLGAKQAGKQSAEIRLLCLTRRELETRPRWNCDPTT
jgi:hypothetical protein